MKFPTGKNDHMDIEILSPQDPRWLESLRFLPHDLYSLPGYHEVEAQRIGAIALALFGRDSRGCVLLPLLIRDLPDLGVYSKVLGTRDATSAYGYPGVSLVTESGDESKLWTDFIEHAAPVLSELQVINLFLRLNPCLNEPGWFGGRGALVAHGETTWIDLHLPPEELNRQTRDRFRSNIRAAQKDSLKVEIDPSWSNLGVFTDLYRQTMRQVGAEDWYFFSDSYFDDLRRRTGDRIHLFIVRSDEGIPAAGLFSECNGIVQYLFSGKDESGVHPHATKLMMVEVRDWAKARGNRIMHLGGGLGARADSLSQFKRGFSRLFKPFHTWRYILNPQLYNELSKLWEQMAGQTADDQTGYFPAYRKPTINRT